MSQIVLTEAAESASNLINRTLGAHLSTVAALPPRGPQGRLAPVAQFDDEQLQCQATLVRFLSITEAFAGERMTELIGFQVSEANSALIERVWEDAAIKGTSTWHELQQAYKKWLGVTVDWKAIENLGEARNAVAHGLGSMTRRQRRKEQSVKEQLKNVGIDVLDDWRLFLSRESVESAAKYCLDMISRIDEVVQLEHPN